MKVNHFQRKPGAYTFSIEGEFAAIRDELAHDADLKVSVVECPLSNRGPFRWVANATAASLHQANVNHITGDVHYLAWTLTPSRTVMTVHDCGFEDRLAGWRRRVAMTTLLAGPARRVARVTTPSTFTRDRLLALTGVDPQKVEIVPLCISPAFRPATKHFDDTCPTILHVGTMRNKNLERLIAALGGLRCRLHIIGQLTAGQNALLDASGLDVIKSVHLSAHELIAAYVTADIVAFVSTYEGFGMPILEAQTVGRPVITSNITAMPETAGKGACLVDPTDVSAIRAAIDQMIRSGAYRDEVVSAGFVNARRFSATLAAERFRDIYASVGL